MIKIDKKLINLANIIFLIMYLFSFIFFLACIALQNTHLMCAFGFLTIISLLSIFIIKGI
jgi:hypothetical protein